MEAADEDAEIIFGTVIDESLEDQVKVTVIATGLCGLESAVTQLPVRNKTPDVIVQTTETTTTSTTTTVTDTDSSSTDSHIQILRLRQRLLILSQLQRQRKKQ